MPLRPEKSGKRIPKDRCCVMEVTGAHLCDLNECLSIGPRKKIWSIYRRDLLHVAVLQNYG